MKDLEIQVGDRVTYACTEEYVYKILTSLVTTNKDIDFLTFENKEIIKVERIGSNGWDTVYEKEEKKDLLTEEEREFLNAFSKMNCYVVDNLIINKNNIILFYKSNLLLACYKTNYNHFRNLERERVYMFSELRLEE